MENIIKSMKSKLFIFKIIFLQRIPAIPLKQQLSLSKPGLGIATIQDNNINAISQTSETTASSGSLSSFDSLPSFF